MASSSKPIIVLRSSQDWDEWYFIVKSQAKRAEIFEFVDPDKKIKPLQPSEPIRPERRVLSSPGTTGTGAASPEATAAAAAAAAEDLHWLREEYKRSYKRYERQKRDINDLASLIESSISQSLTSLLAKHDDSHPHTQLRALRARLQPSVSAQEELYTTQLRSLERPPTNQNLEKWLAQWEDVVIKAQRINLADVQGTRGIKAFLKPLLQTDADYASPLLTGIRQGTETRDVLDIIADFREHLQLKQSMEGKQPRNHFAASFRSRGQFGSNEPMCLCGKNHYYAKCYYLNKEVRPSGWKPLKEIQAKIQKRMSDPTTKQRVQNALERSKRQNNSSDGQKQITAAGEDDESVATFLTILADDRQEDEQPTALSSRREPPSTLELSWIADTGSTHHVCNRFMRSRYTKTREAMSSDYVKSGSQHTQVESFGTVKIKATTAKGVKTITLVDVAMVPSFMANLVSMSKAKSNGIFLDTEHDTLRNRQKVVLCQLTHKSNHFFIELNESSERSSAAAETSMAATVESRPATQWHQIFAHAGAAAIKALPGAVEGAVVTNEESLSDHCDTCARTKAQQQISRSPDHELQSNQVFYRMTGDLVQMTEAYNRDEWISHGECDSCGYTLVETHKSKDGCNEAFESFLNQIETLLNQRVVIFRTDGEKSFNNRFKKRIAERGITWEVSAPYTPAQNGHAERSGKTLVVKARALKSASNLPERLWPEIVKTAVYLSNRTPRQSLNWRTPYEMVFGKKPRVNHLRIYGCKAYALDKHIIRTHKLKDRALIGYLVGYDSTNIYCIWMPANDKIIKTRDVTFDESTRYSPEDEYAALEELSEELTHVERRQQQSFEEVETESSEEEFDQELVNRARATAPTPTSSQQSPVRDNALESSETIHKPISSQGPLLTPSPTERGASEDPRARDAAEPQEQARAQSSEEFGPLGGEPLVEDEEQPPEQPSEQSAGHAPERLGAHSRARSSAQTRGRSVGQSAGQSSDQASEPPQRLGRLLPAVYDTPPDPAAARGNRAPRGGEINSTPGPASIQQGPRSRRQTKRDAYMAMIVTNAVTHKAYEKALNRALTSIIWNNERLSFAASVGPNGLPRIHRDQLPKEPRNYAEIMRHPLRDFILQAIQEELNLHNVNGVWFLVPADEARRNNKTPLPLTWVIKWKIDQEAHLNRVRARICVRGDLQTTDLDTYASTLAFRILRTLMAVICAFDLDMRQFDIVNAFPHATLNTKTYLQPPDGMNNAEGKVLLLKRALYGLKESPILWQRHFCGILAELGLLAVPDAPCLFANDHLIVFFFVDDVIIAYYNKHEALADSFEARLGNRLSLKPMGEPQWFLSHRIIRDRQQRRIWLSQEQYISGLTAKYKVKKSSWTPPTPLLAEERLHANSGPPATPQDVHTYQSKIGSAQFSASSTRPDIAYACSALSSFLTNPSARHLDLAQRLLEYLESTKHLAMSYDGYVLNDQRIFNVASDASFANDEETRRSHQGSLITLFGGSVDWRSSRQPTVTTSTTEAELLALSDTAKQTYWWRRFFSGIQFDPGHDLEVQCDNQQTLRLMNESVGKLDTKLRHVDIHHHWLRQEAQAGRVHFRWTPTADMIADGLTKALPRQKHAAFVNQLGLSEPPKRLPQQEEEPHNL